MIKTLTNVLTRMVSRMKYKVVISGSEVVIGPKKSHACHNFQHDRVGNQKTVYAIYTYMAVSYQPIRFRINVS